jgi:fructose-specific phosphotransferase system component IIB
MACPTGIAHTVMAAEALENTAKLMEHTFYGGKENIEVIPK